MGTRLAVAGTDRGEVLLADEMTGGKIRISEAAVRISEAAVVLVRPLSG